MSSSKEVSVKASLRSISIALLVLISLSTNVLALRPEIGYRVVPSDYGIIYDHVEFETPDGLTLKGWFYPAQDTTGIANKLVGRLMPVPPDLKPSQRSFDSLAVQPGPTIVIGPGDAGNMAYAILYAYNFFTRGFNVFTFDWRGFGESDAWPIDPDDLICTEFLADYSAALDYIQSRPETDPSRLGLLGFSTGAYMSFAMAAERNDVAALAGRATITTFDDLLPILTHLDPDRAWHLPKNFPLDLLPAAVAPQLTTPVLLVVGDQDDRTPAWMSQRIFEMLTGPKELWVVPGAGHGGRLAPEIVAYDEFFAKASAFFAAHFGDDSRD